MKLIRKRLSIVFSGQGFTLAELLIALAILGVIATFTIPKVLNSGSGAKSNAIVKEIAATVSQAHQQLKLEGQLNANTSINDFTVYMNYVKVATIAIDSTPGGQQHLV